MRVEPASEFIRQFPFEASINDQIRALLKAATRAPSTHNSQPWCFGFDDARLSVYRDSRVELPQSDSVTRYAHISVGFLLEHIIRIGDWLGMAPRLTPIFCGNHIADVGFSPGRRHGAIDPAAAAVFLRRNRRGTFTATPIEDNTVRDALRTDTGNCLGSSPESAALTSPADIAQLASLAYQNMRRVYRRPEFRREMSKFIVPSNSVRRDGMPGYSLNQPLLVSQLLPHVIRFFDVGAILGGVTRTAIASAPAIFGFACDDGPAGWVPLGYAASRAVLSLTAQGLDCSVFVAVAEYPDTRAEAKSLFGFTCPFQFMFAAGKLTGQANWMTPRLALEQKTLTP